MEENPYQSPEIPSKRPLQVRPRTVEGVMAAAREEIRRNTRWLKIVTGVVLVLLLYVLSFGPYFSAYAMGGAPFLGEVFYSPIYWVMENSKTAAQVLVWYAKLWL